ncbi:hypothetical protein F5050DRAFT_1765059 [Lentinula boryana]|uniref:Secreted protein n=1 Tax=Lentinula boryana TaxID=40481 RepID=A0ABQ8QAZ7_9AGAR|nr:hypothetical protein F5050DRAFT_1765059 [Lentinula boryana]
MRFFFAYLLLGIIAVVYARPLNDPRRDLIIESRTHWYVRSQGDPLDNANGVNGHANGVNGQVNVVNGHTNGVQQPSDAHRAERAFVVHVRFIGDAGESERGRPVNNPPVPMRIQQRLEAYFLRVYHSHCEVRFASRTAYMLQDVEAAFTFQYQWEGMSGWEDGNLPPGV